MVRSAALSSPPLAVLVSAASPASEPMIASAVLPGTTGVEMVLEVVPQAGKAGGGELSP